MEKITKASGTMQNGYYTYGKNIEMSFPVPRSLDSRLYSVAVALGFTYPWHDVPMSLFQHVFEELSKIEFKDTEHENFSVLRPHSYLYHEPILKSKYFSKVSNTCFSFSYPTYTKLIETGRNPITNEVLPFEFVEELRNKIKFIEQYQISEILTIPDALAKLNQNDKLSFH